ncbi:MAG: hypothetical protein GX561_12325 [Lentisphaerae bacterium]|jgi:hypothetical protein|nr:hypothetical protein [Lentisphaerota bacterium]
MLKRASLIVFASLFVFAWNGFEVKNGDFTLLISELETISNPRVPTPFQVTVTSEAKEAAQATVEIYYLADQWRIDGDSKRTMSINPGSSAQATFSLVSGPLVFSTRYPIHARATITAGQQTTTIEAVRIFNVLVKDASGASERPDPLPIVKLDKNDQTKLVDLLPNVRVAWNYLGKPMVYKPIGWTGTDPVAACNVHKTTPRRGGISLPSIGMHPCWKPEIGPVFADFKLKLPRQKPISFDFNLAIRDHHPQEIVSDGVLFRVYVSENDTDFKEIFQDFTDSKIWKKAQADLSKYAGKTITLRLEAHPGPNNHVYTDQCYWGDPTITTGNPKRHAKKTKTSEGILKLAAKDKAASCKILVDGNSPIGNWIAIPSNRTPETVAFRGFSVALDGIQSPKADSVKRRTEGNKTIYIHKYKLGNDVKATLRVETWVENEAAKFKFHCEGARISSIKQNEWRRPIAWLYYGHGYAIALPGKTRFGFDGHNFSSSHIGIDFSSNSAVLVAVDNPPASLENDLVTNFCAIETTDNATFTIVPHKTAFQAAIHYQPMMDKKPAPNVEKLAGRFLFDFWGGSFEQLNTWMQEAAKYGLANAVLAIHNWQHWGYDYRLPEIWPPNERVGTIEQLQALGETCDKPGIRWGLHDNYTDFYPDALGYSVNQTLFWKYPGNPANGWYNKGRDAHALFFKPAAIAPFVKRNYQAISEHVKPTHSFVDVLSSMGPIEYYDHNGKFYTRSDTRRHWGEVFDEIRRNFGPNTTTTSEAGHDQLIGYLDGADCQRLQIRPFIGDFITHFPCDDWEFVPWADAVNHHRFVWQGSGYSNRYEGSGMLLRDEHGIVSDDYLSTELLSGHSLMMDYGGFGYHAIRKYWLAQNFIESIAARKMTNHEFVGNIHRQSVAWDTGAVVHVNRDKKPWNIDGHMLPKYGFLAKYAANAILAFEVKDGLFREYSATPEGIRYANARPRERSVNPNTINAYPRIENVTDHGKGKFSYDLIWDVEQPAIENWHAFTHFNDMKDSKIHFQDDHTPPVPPTQWKPGTTVSIRRTVTIPVEETLEEYKMFVGLYRQQGLMMIPLQREGVCVHKAHVANLKVKREDGVVTSVTLTKIPPRTADLLQLNPGNPVINFGFVKTNGACRIIPKNNNAFELVLAPKLPKATYEPNLEELLPNAKSVKVVATNHDDQQKILIENHLAVNPLTLELDPKDIFKVTITTN